MKLLLTSAGITTQAIAEALGHLVGKNGNRKVGFVPTAANAEGGNKDWYIGQITNLQKYGFDWIDFIDPSAANSNWRERLDGLGIVFVSGGNTFHLLDQARRTGFDAWLQAHKERIVYVGSSAGSILATPTIAIAAVDDGDRNLCGLQDLRGLNWVDFEISPHTPSEVSQAGNEAYAKTTSHTLYAINDNSAIVVEDTAVRVIHDGMYWQYDHSAM